MTKHKNRLFQALAKARLWLDNGAQGDVTVTPCPCGEVRASRFQPELHDLRELIVALDTARQANHSAEAIARADVRGGRCPIRGNIAERIPGH